MRIKQRFDTKEEYLDFAWSIINFNGNIWREEDIPKLAPFIYNRNASIVPGSKIDEAFKFYKECLVNYADHLFDIKESRRNIHSDYFYEFFFLTGLPNQCFETDEHGNDLDVEGNIILPESRKLLDVNEIYNITFPMVFVGWFNSEDRDYVMFSDFVNL